MTDTDKLKRLAEEALKYDPTGWRKDAFKEPEALAILALIAENERLRSEKQNMQAAFNDAVGECDKLSTERDEVVAMLWRAWSAGRDMSEWREVAAFLSRIDGDA